MGLLAFLNKNKLKDISHYEEMRYGTITFPEKLTDSNAFELASTVSEIFWPIDFISDRISKLRFYIADRNGKELPSTELNRFLTDINPLFSFNDLVYQFLFSLNSDGNGYARLNAPETYRDLSGNLKLTQNNITRCDILRPKDLAFREFSNMSIYNISSYNDLIADAWLSNNNGFIEHLTRNQIDNLYIAKLDSSIRLSSSFLASTPLYKSIRPINNLLATYSARYNSYVNNGMAGVLYKKKGNNIPDIGDAISSAMGGNRDKLVEDIKNKNGITGKRNFFAVTDQEVGFINTLAAIKDLMPFEETLEDSIKIASVYQLPSELIPQKDRPKYENLIMSEKSVWENSLTSMTDFVCQSFTRMFRFKNEKILADYSNVSCLVTNEKEKEANMTTKLANLQTLLKFNPEDKTIKNIIIKIIEDYGKGY